MAALKRSQLHTPLSDSLTSPSPPKRQRHYSQIKSWASYVGASTVSSEPVAERSYSEYEDRHDDKVLSVEDTEEICFGTLEEIQIMLKWQPRSTVSDISPLGIDGRPLKVLPLNFHDTYCSVQTEDGYPIGVLENRALKHLLPLSRSHYMIRFEGVIQESTWQERLTSSKTGGRVQQLLTLEVDLFGPRHMSDEVAKVLGRAKFFLQRPSRRILPPYENPQCLQLAYGVSSMTVNSVLPLLRSGEQNLSETRRSDDSALKTSSFDLDQIFDGLRPQEFTGNISVDSRVVTPLLRHQLEGLEFLISRETLAIPDHRTLWEPLALDAPIVGYRHAITGAKSRSADDSPGGILADDMGLGKTLTMIALLLCSYSRAEEFALQDSSTKLHLIDGGPPVSLKATLIVVPSELLLTNWVEEIKKHTFKDTVKYYKYHGKDRHVQPLQFRDYDIVFTTYGTLAADVGKRGATLARIRWYRIILDEAHIIRNWTTKQFNATLAIPSQIRWCMTGTPIQNNVEDLGALVRFLRLPILEEVTVFRQYISSEVQVKESFHKNNYPNLRLLLGSICLRRAQAILRFRCSTEIIRPTFNEDEEKDYRNLEMRCKEALSYAASSKNSRAAHQNVLEKLLRLREFCNGLTLGSESSPEATFNLMQQDGQVCCEYCSMEIISLEVNEGGSSITITECRRAVCADLCCIDRYIAEVGPQGSETKICPFCKLEHRESSILEERYDSMSRKPRNEYPTKLLRLLDDIRVHGAEDKCIVFSLWKRTLDLVEKLLETQNIRYCRVDGSVSTAHRRQGILDTFQRQNDIRVLIMTLGTGAVGLNNLSVASRVYLLEPQWNPSVEKQAIGRILRLGQKKEVKIVRFIMKHSIEELVEKCQQKKLNLAAGGFNILKAAQDSWLS